MPKYECDQCGACCRKLIIEIDEIDIIREPKLAEVSQPFRATPGMELVNEDGSDYEPLLPEFANGAMLTCGKPCPMLDGDNRCTIYPSRPNVCVAFRAGSDQCQEAREAAGLPELATT